MSVDERVSAHHTPSHPAEDQGRIVARFAIAVGVSGLVSALLWEVTPRRLSGFTDVVGYPTFADFDYQRAFRGYHISVYAFPAIALAVYSVLAWRGPLCRPKRASHQANISLTDTSRPASHSRPSARVSLTPLNHTLRLALPAALTAICVSSRTNTPSRDFSSDGLIAAAVYGLLVLAAAGVTQIFRGMGSDTATASYGEALSAVNGIGGTCVSLIGLWFASRHTVIVVAGTQPHWWHWFPFWVAVVSIAGACGWMALVRRRGVGFQSIEASLLAVVTGSTLVFLGFALLPGALGAFAGFDDAQSLVGGNLLSRGYFPWRDQFFIHGLLFDVLQGNVGFSVFGNTRWGGAAGSTVLVTPIDWVMTYLLVLRVARRNWWLVGAFVAVAVGGVFDPLDTRFILLAPTLLLLGEVIRRDSRKWTFAFALLVVVDLILTPESVFFVPALLVALCGSEIVHRDRQLARWRALKKTGFAVGAACAQLACFALYLALNHSLGAFVQWYVVFGPGHSAGAAIPPTTVSDRDWFEFFLAIGLVLLTIWAAAYRIRGSRRWSSLDWMVVAAAGSVALYGEKPLGRFDGGHIQQFVTVALPLALMWFAKIAMGLERTHARFVARSLAVPSLSLPVSAVAAVVIAFLVPSLSSTVRAIPGRLHAVAPSAPTIPYAGYSTPDGVDPVLVSDLGTVLDTYAGPDGEVFDMTNSMGYIYYLLQRRPATKFVHIDMAITAYAQKMVIGELRHSKPPVVLFESSTTGLADWDGISPSVRHYDIAQYVLDGWTPILDTHGLLVLLRNDLLAARPALPRLQVPATTTRLFDVTAGCNWGYAANFLKSVPSGRSVSLNVRPDGDQQVDTFTGWAADPSTRVPASELVLTVAGRQIASSVQAGAPRADVAAAIGAQGQDSGFTLSATVAAGSDADVFEVGSDRKLHQLRHSVTQPLATGSVRLLTGESVSIGAPGLGSLDSVTSRVVNVRALQVPTDVDLSTFDLATFKATGPLGAAQVTLTDAIGSASDAIVARSVGSASNSLSLRVGTCLQWHGYNARTLYVTQSGGSPITSVTLSGVR